MCIYGPWLALHVLGFSMVNNTNIYEHVEIRVRFQSRHQASKVWIVNLHQTDRWRKFTYRSESRILHRRVTVLCRKSLISIVTRRDGTRDARPIHSVSTASKPSLANPISQGCQVGGVWNWPLISIRCGFPECVELHLQVRTKQVYR